MNSNNGGKFEEFKASIDNPFLESQAASSNVSETSLTYSVSSTSSFDKKMRKHLKKQAILRQIFLSWRAYTTQVKQDKELFVRIRDFIIRRLTKLGFKALKVNYQKQLLYRHYLVKHRKRVSRDVFRAWNAVLTTKKLAALSIFQSLSALLDRSDIKIGFFSLLQNSQVQSQLLQSKQQKDFMIKTNVFQGLHQNLVLRIKKREWALQVMLRQEENQKQLVAKVYLGFRLYVKITKRQKRLRVKALRLFARTTKKHGLAQWILYISLCHHNRQLNLLSLNLLFKSQQQKLKNCFQAWRCLQDFKKNNMSNLFEKLTKVILVKQMFKALQLYAKEIVEREDILLQKRFFIIMKNYVKYRREVRQLERDVQTIYYRNLFKKVLREWKKYFGITLDFNKIIQIILKQEVRQAFLQIKKYCLMKKGLEDLVQIIQSSKLRKAFKWLQVIKSIQVFSEERMQLISLRLRFQVWKDASECDRRIAKMLIRAGKHRNRVLLPKAFKAMKRLVKPEVEMMPSRIIQLKEFAIKRWKQYIMKRRVQRYQVQKAYQQYRQNTLAKYLESMNLLTRKRQEKRETLEMLFRRFSTLKNRKLISKSLIVLKKQAYQRRVSTYLISLKQTSLRATYFQRLKDAYLSHHTDTYKYKKSQNHHTSRLMSSALYALYQYRKQRFIMRVQYQRALNSYCLRLMQQALQGLWIHRTYRHEKNRMIREAHIDHQRERLQGCLKKLVSVGIYWTQIKGRFGAGRQSRIYLGLKYGLRWRAKALMSRYKGKGLVELTNGPQIISSQVTEVAKKQLIPSAKSKNTSLVRSSMQYNVQPQRPMSSTQRAGFFQPPQDRIGEIEREITQFKQKKMLLKELEEQQTVMSQQYQQSPVIFLLQQKISGLRSELLMMQPKIKDMLLEIAKIRTQQNSTQKEQVVSNSRSILLSPGLTSIEQDPRRMF